MKIRRTVTVVCVLACLVFCGTNLLEASWSMGTTFTYQGRLIDSNEPANGLYDFLFMLCDDPCTPGYLTVDAVDDVQVDDGYFTVRLNFAHHFNGDARWMQINVRPGDSTGGYPILFPRQELTPTPYSIYATDAGDAARLDGHLYSEFALSAHNHTGVYSLLGHDHASWYAALSHNHSGVYSVVSHNHTGVYAPSAHLHNSDYVNVTGDDMTGDLTVDGRIGIGTVSPSTILDLEGVNPHLSLNTITASGGYETAIDMQENGSDRWRMGYNTGSNYLYFYNPGGAGTAMVLRDTTGYVGIGTASPANRLELPNTASAAGTGRAFAWTIYSSRKWKKNIMPIDNPLEKVKKLRGVYFDWKSNDKHDMGMIAEEVAEIIPEVAAVSEDGSDVQSLDYSRLVSLLIEAVKEQDQKITKLEEVAAENEALKERLATLEQIVQRLAVTKEVQL